MRTLALAVTAAVALSGSALALSPDDFKVDSAAALVKLCSAQPTDEHYTAATHFCHGYGSGAFHYYKIQALADPKREFVCFAEPLPTRTQVINDFVAWAKARPQYMSNDAVDVLFRYLGETYPCAK